MNQLDNVNLDFPNISEAVLNGITTINGTLSINGPLIIAGSNELPLDDEELIKLREMINDWEREKYPERFL